VIPPPDRELKDFLRCATSRNPGIGVVDTRSGKIYLAAASILPDGDHASLLETKLGIRDLDGSRDMRGFVVVPHDDRFQFINNSGLNPRRNQMEEHLFKEVTTVLTKRLQSLRQDTK
jgi:hypothetical protein